MNVLAYDKYPAKELENKDNVKYAELDELFENSDIISLHCPLTEETHYIIDKKAIDTCKKGVIIIEKASTSIDEEELMMVALEAGAEDFEASEEIYEITTDPSDFSAVREKLEEQGLEFLEAEVQMVPTTTVVLDEKGIEKMERLIERLEDLDDVSNIYHNWEE